MTDEFPKITGITEIKWKDLATLSELYQMPPEYLKMPDGN